MTEYCPICWKPADFDKINDGLYRCNKCGNEFDKPVKQRKMA